MRVGVWLLRCFIPLLLCGALLSALYGCSRTEPPQADEAKKVELTVLLAEPGSEEESRVWRDIVRGYMSLRPDVAVRLDYIQPNPSVWRTRLSTMLEASTAPDIVQTQFAWSQSDYRHHLLADLTPYFEWPNPYRDNRKWKDMFPRGVASQIRDPETGAMPAVSLYFNTVKVYYNRDLFRSLNLQVPHTWQQFIDVQDRIGRHGVVPFAFANGDGSERHYVWAVNSFINQMGGGRIPQFDLNGDGMIQLNEIAGAVDQGRIDLESDDWNAFMPHLKAWSNYWPDDYQVLDNESALAMFLDGDAAMVMSDDAGLREIAESAARQFEYGTFDLPAFTASGEAGSTGSGRASEPALDGVFSVPATVRGDRLEAAIDFLMYLSSPDVARQLGQRLYRTTTVPYPGMARTVPDAGSGAVMHLFHPATDQQLYDSLIQVGKIYLNDTISLEKYMRELNRTLRQSAERLMEENNWNRDNGYGLGKAQGAQPSR